MANLYNTGAFKFILQSKLEELFLKRMKEKDPYEQYNLDSQKRLVEDLLNQYNEDVKKQIGV